MSLQSVRSWLAAYGPDLNLIEVEESTATVETAARALGVEPGRIAKTLAVRAGDQLFLLVARGDARLDNRKCKDEFGARPRMLGAPETLELTGHPVGGVCPFGLKTSLPVYLDVSLRAFDIVYPAGGSLNTSVEVQTDRLFELVAERWVDLCRLDGVDPANAGQKNPTGSRKTRTTKSRDQTPRTWSSGRSGRDLGLHAKHRRLAMAYPQ